MMEEVPHDKRTFDQSEEPGQDPEDAEDEWDADDTTRMHSIPWTGMTFFPITQLDDNVVPDVSGILPIPHQEDRQESVPKRQSIGPSLGETMRTRLIEKLM